MFHKQGLLDIPEFVKKVIHGSAFMSGTSVTRTCVHFRCSTNKAYWDYYKFIAFPSLNKKVVHGSAFMFGTSVTRTFPNKAY